VGSVIDDGDAEDVTIIQVGILTGGQSAGKTSGCTHFGTSPGDAKSSTIQIAIGIGAFTDI